MRLTDAERLAIEAESREILPPGTRVERLVPATLARLLGPYESWSMRDRLVRLEKLGLLDVDRWLEWRDVRNRLAHEYPNAPELRDAAVLAAIHAAAALIGAYDHWKAKLPT
jgi:hypothetical protein